MKKWHFLAVLTAFFTVLPAMAGCASGQTVDLPQNYSDFTRLDIQNAFDVQVVQSGTFAVTITSSKSLVDFLSVSEDGDTLTLTLHPNQPFTDFTLMRKVLKAKITMPALSGITLSGASRCTVGGFESKDPLDLDISGASTLQLSGITIGSADFVVSGASQLNGKVTAADTKFDISGASQVKLAGAASDVQLVGAGASKVDLEQFVNQTATVTLSGATQATVDTRQHLDFSVSGASQFYFLSNPVTGKMEVLGAATVKHKS